MSEQETDGRSGVIERAINWLVLASLRFTIFWWYHAALAFGYGKPGLVLDGPDVFELVDPRVPHNEVFQTDGR